jgi:ribonuclease-3
MAVDPALQPPVHPPLSAAREPAEARLEERIAHRFGDPGLLRQALTHSSAAAETGLRPEATYQRLEFLGDRVLALVVADMLVADFPTAAEGELARRLTALVRNDACAGVAREIDLGAAIRLGGGELQSGGRAKAAILGDVCEAVIGALYLDGGVEAARTFIEAHWRERMLAADAPLRDAKTTLQEWAQGRGLAAPAYTIVARSGPEHAPRFVIEASVVGLDPGRGEGGSRRAAEQEAAALILLGQGVWKSASG